MRLFGYAIGSAAIGFIAGPLVFLAWALHGVHFPTSAEVTSQRVIELETADGQPLLSKGSYRLAPVAVKDMPGDVVNAVVSIEDRRFYEHGSIDLRAMLRAFVDNFQADQIVSGGSTISQQLAKMLFLNPQRTYKRKIQEAAIATWLELHLSKDQILTSYLNNVYLGSGAFGLPAAAKLYFGKSLGDLNVSEAAMLAGMIRAPNEYDPLRNLDAARRRAGAVIDAMVSSGHLSEEAALSAKLHPATPTPATKTAPSAGGWFADWTYDRAASVIPALSGTVRVRTTLDPHLQQLAEDAVKSVLAEYGADKHASEAALVAMRPDGAVLAMVGGTSYSESQFNRAVQAKRQPGSAFKLFDYYAALRKGYSVNDEVLDEPVDVKGWEPDNYGMHYHGRVSLAEAFAHSLNAATVRLSQQVGIDQVIEAARDLGLHAPLGKNPSLALGTSEVSLLDLTSAYAAVRAGMAPVEPWGIAELRLSGDGRQVEVGRPSVTQHSLGQYQGQLIDLLKGVVDHGTGRAAALPGFAAGKTGTSQDYRDAWFIGFNDSLVAGVWVGNDDHSPMKSVVGGSLPATIWKRFMEQAGNVGVAQGEQPQLNGAQVSGANDRNASPTSNEPKQASSEPTNDNNAAAATGGESAQCDIPVCQQFYHSFRASDCSYQPYWGGPRRYCDR